MQGNRRRMGRRIRSVGAAVAALVLALTVAVGLGAAPAQAGTTLVATHKCASGKSGSVKTCLVIHGSGGYVKDATAKATNDGSGRTLKLCITGPLHFEICDIPSYVGPGDTILLPWHPMSYVTAGSYYARTYAKTSKGSFTQVSEVRITLP